MMVEPSTFLRRIRSDFHLAGGKILVRNFLNRSEILSLDESVIINCTGLGAKALFDNEDLIPIKGQLLFMQPDPAIDYLTIGGGSGVTYMCPRKGEILLGGSYQSYDWSRNVERGDSDAQVNLGLMCGTGSGVIEDDKEAVKWLRLAAEQLDSNAQNNLGVITALVMVFFKTAI